MDAPATRSLIDALVLHHVGSDANIVPVEAAAAYKRFGREKPLFQNEYEYLNGQTTPARCMNTVLHIMNWFQLGEAPTWFWIHALRAQSPTPRPAATPSASGVQPMTKTPPTTRSSPDSNPASGRGIPITGTAVGSFVKHLPWNSRAISVTEAVQDPDLRIFAFTKPDGKLVVALANRSFSAHTFKLATGLAGSTRFAGYRYTPDNARSQHDGCAHRRTSRQRTVPHRSRHELGILGAAITPASSTDFPTTQSLHTMKPQSILLASLLLTTVVYAAEPRAGGCLDTCDSSPCPGRIRRLPRPPQANHQRHRFRDPV